MSGIIFLIGMPGSGKTRWGGEAAAFYDLSFVDLDGYIEHLEGKTIKEIFDEDGEQVFRAMEKNALMALVAQNKAPFILSCGGGTPIDEENFKLMKSRGCIVYLEAEPERLFANLQAGMMQRPLLADSDDPFQQLKKLYEERKIVYEQADFILDTENLSLGDFKKIIETCIEQH